MRVLMVVLMVVFFSGCEMNRYNAISANGPVYKEQCDVEIASLEYFNDNGCTGNYQQ